MPKGLVIGALALLALVVLGLTWLSNRSVAPETPAAATAEPAAPVTNDAQAAPPPAASASAPVVLTATEAVWIQVKDGANTLKMGELAAGESFAVPATAAAPVLTTGKPEALRIMVGSTAAPAVGEAGKTVSNVSLKPADLMNPTTAAPAPGAPPVAQPASPPPAARRRATPTSPSQPPASAPAETNVAGPTPGQQ